MEREKSAEATGKQIPSSSGSKIWPGKLQF